MLNSGSFDSLEAHQQVLQLENEPDKSTERQGLLQSVSFFLGFGFLLLSFAGTAYFNYQQFYQASTQLADEITNNDSQAAAATSMRVAVRERAILLWQMSIQSDPFERDELFLKFREFGGRYQTSRRQYLNTRLTDTEKEMLLSLDQETNKRAPMLREFSESLMASDGLQVFTPQLNQVLTNQIIVANILDEIITGQRVDNQLAHENNHKQTRALLYQLIIMVSIILVIGVLFSWRVIHAINVQRHELYEANQELHLMSRRDPLTGLHNRIALMEHLRLNVALAARHEMIGALMFIDLDGFKEINDTYGHDIGDGFLIEIASQMNSLRESDVIARLGGDEFVVIVMNLHQQEDAYTVARKLLERLSATYEIEDKRVSASASIGICFFPEADISVEELLGCADNAMYTAKKSGKNCYFVGKPAHFLNP